MGVKIGRAFVSSAAPSDERVNHVIRTSLISTNLLLTLAFAQTGLAHHVCEHPPAATGPKSADSQDHNHHQRGQETGNVTGAIRSRGFLFRIRF
jgi:hypothetical protein